jgi:CheY-like chemotaxis protein
VFIAGQPEETVRKRITAAGAIGYLSKPCNEQALSGRLGKALGTTSLVK